MDGAGFNRALNLVIAMVPSNQMSLQFLSMTEEIEIIRTNAYKSESLAVCDTSFTVMRVTAGQVKQ